MPQFPIVSWSVRMVINDCKCSWHTGGGGGGGGGGGSQHSSYNLDVPRRFEWASIQPLAGDVLLGPNHLIRSVHQV